MIRLIKPKYFMPVHGEYRMLKKHADIAVLCNIPKDNTFILGNGDVLNIKNGIVTKEGIVPAGNVYVDGNKIGDIDNVVMRERKMMSKDGIIIVTCSVNRNKLLTTPNITTRGFVMVNDNIELLHELEKVSESIINNKLNQNCNYNEIKNAIITELSNYAYDKTGRKPTILPILMEIKKEVTI